MLYAAAAVVWPAVHVLFLMQTLNNTGDQRRIDMTMNLDCGLLSIRQHRKKLALLLIDLEELVSV